MDIAHLDKLLEIVGDVRAEIVAAGPQFARGQLRVADVEQKQRLNAVYVRTTGAIEFVLDDVE
jgi:hypothetical protein